MSESACDHLKRFLSEVDGILGIFVADKDGVVVASATMDDMPDQARSPYVTAAFIVSLQQVNKLDLGELEWMITSTDTTHIALFPPTVTNTVVCHHFPFRFPQICQFHFTCRLALPLFLTVVGSSECNIGAVIALEPSIRPLLNRLAPEASSRIQNEAILSRTNNGPYFRV
ncbi:Mitogen-activated protein kinase kinase 1 interacting protein 1 [Schistosoma japonicum]|nr:Mitogen-activated protein kinase kinase 1 interacting protein 1 [Schistosoma japonicum]